MKKKALSLLMAGILALSMSGCGSLFAAEYHYSEPYVDSVSPSNGNAVEVRNYNMLKTAIVGMISRHEEQGGFRFSNYNGSVVDDLAAVCFEIKNENPLAAYAVESLTHDTSRIVSYYTATVHITYQKTKEQIDNIIGANNIVELQNRLREKVFAQEQEIVTRIYSPLVDETVVADMVREAYFSDPVVLISEPTAEIVMYPKGGINHVYDISLQYALTGVTLQNMTKRLDAAVETLLGALPDSEGAMLALNCANSVYAQLSGSGAAYPSTAYGALVEHSADSKGMALAYQALCNAAGVDCRVVMGAIGSMGTEEHYWNIIKLGEDYYHVDISQFQFDRNYAFLMSDEMLWGTYIWETEKYPDCSGTLRYGDLISSPGEVSTAEPETEIAEKVENNA